MLKKTIKYTNPFTNEEVEEDFYFHLTKAELIEMEMSREGGLSETLKRIAASEDGKQIIAEFKNIILSSYGIRSEDGRFFKKTEELSAEFESSEAYSALFMELVTNTDAAIEFCQGIIPAGLSDEDVEKIKKDMQTIAEEEEAKPELTAVPDVEESKGAVEIITRRALTSMTQDELANVMRRVEAGEAKLEADPLAT